MDYSIQRDCTRVDWAAVRDALIAVGMSHRDPFDLKRAFEGSFAVAFVYQKDELIGFGRAISDGVYQAAIYDVVVLPDHQRQGIGRAIMEELLEKVAKCNVILYANPGKEEFYTKLGFRIMKTGMAKFLYPERMQSVGFI